MSLSLVFSVVAAAMGPVDVRVVHCTGVTEHEVRHIVRVELANATAPPNASVDARVDCTERELATVHLDDSVTQKSLSRTVALARVPKNALARSLALAIVELVEASWAELALPPRLPQQTEAPPSVALPPPSPAREEPEAEHRITVDVFGLARRLPWAALWQAGAGCRFSWWPRWFGFSFEVDGADGSRRMALGDVNVFAASAALSARARVSLLGPLGVGGAVGARVGFGSITGTPSDPTTARGNTVDSIWAGPFASATVDARWSRVFAFFAAEVGASTFGLQGTAGASVGPGLVGPWLTLALGFGGQW